MARSEHGTAVWTSPGWRREALEWTDRSLRGAGIDRTGEIADIRIRPWAAVLKIFAGDRVVWLKAAAPDTAFEAGLYALLNRLAPCDALSPIAIDTDRGWMLLPDGGRSIGETHGGEQLRDAFLAGVTDYARLQRRLQPHTEELLEAGVQDMRPAVMPERFREALAAASDDAERLDDATALARLRTIAGLENDFAEWCDRLARSSVGPSLDHNDLHPWNMLGGPGEPIRFLDWGDSVVAHPFAAMLVPLGIAESGIGEVSGGPELVRSVREAYLAEFDDSASRAELEETLALACRIGKVARALVWDRALRSARAQGEEIKPSWITGTLEYVLALDEPGWSVGS